MYLLPEKIEPLITCNLVRPLSILLRFHIGNFHLVIQSIIITIHYGLGEIKECIILFRNLRKFPSEIVLGENVPPFCEILTPHVALSRIL
jgi:hypothetical protein